MTLKMYFYLGIGFVLLIAVFSCSFIYLAAVKIDRQRDFSLSLEQELVSTTSLRASVRNQIVETYEAILLDPSSKRLPEAKLNVAKNLQEFHSIATKVHLKDNIPDNDMDNTAFLQLKEIHSQLTADLDRSVLLFRQHKDDEGKRLLADAIANTFRNKFLVTIKNQLDKSEINYYNSAEELKSDLFRMKRVILICSVLLLLVVPVLGLQIYKSISSRLTQLIAAAKSISDGAYSSLIKVSGSDEVSALTNEFNSMIGKIQDRTREAKEFERVAIESAHEAGMSEIATGTLHNVGNVLNGANVGTELIIQKLEKSNISGLYKANDLLRDNLDNFDQFYSQDPKGKKLLNYYLELGKCLKEEHDGLKREATDLMKKIQLIKDIINTQQAYAKGRAEFKETVSLAELVESALVMQSDSLIRHEIKIIKNFKEVPLIVCQKSKLVHVFLDLIKNAKEAMTSSYAKENVLTLEIGQTREQKVFLKISDTGLGIEEEKLSKIFTHGFTTKNTGHGFGLHFCANSLTEMGGKISASSEGLGKGAQFTLEFEIQTVTKAA